MRREPPKSIVEYLPVAFPGMMLIVFFAIPFATMITISFFQRDQGGFYVPDFTLENYVNFISPFFGRVLGFSLLLSAIVSLICVAIAFPFTVLLAKQSRKVQAIWLVSLLSILSLSEVILGFAWSVLLSRTAGVSNLLVWIGILDEPVALLPSLGAVLVGIVYQGLPFSILAFYPAVVRLDPTLVEAARTLGSSPLRAFFNVVVPVLRNSLLGTTIMVFVFVLGAYLLPQILGKPHHWTLSILITNQVLGQANLPFGSAMAVLLLLISLTLVGFTWFVGRQENVK